MEKNQYIDSKTENQPRKSMSKDRDFVSLSTKILNGNISTTGEHVTSNSESSVLTGFAAIPKTSTRTIKTNSPDSDDAASINSITEVYIPQETIRACLEKEPSERTESDISTLCSFLERFAAFSNITHGIRLAMCQAMVFAVVEKSGSIVLSEGEELDSWSIIINGQVELLKQNQDPIILNTGDSFGIKPSLQKQYHQGIMRTKTDDCQFVCVVQSDFFRIFNEGQVKLRHIEEDGQIVMITEHRVSDGGMRQGQVVIKATPERLMSHLMEDHSDIDPTYVEDYLLTYRIFYNRPIEIADYLFNCFQKTFLIDKVTKILILWVNTQFKDFSSDYFVEFLEKMEKQYEQRKMNGQVRLLQMTIQMNSPIRTIELERSIKDTKLEFSIISSKDNGGEIYVYKVDPSSKTEHAGLKRGDQILEVNNFSFKRITVIKALDILHQTNFLSMSVKHNKIGFKSVVDGSSSKKDSNNRLLNNDTDKTIDSVMEKGFRKKSIFTAFERMSFFKTNKETKNDDFEPFKNGTPSSSVGSIGGYASRDTSFIGGTMQIIRIFRADHTCRYFHVEKETTVAEVIKMCLESFNIMNNIAIKNFLFQVTVTSDGLVKHRCLQDNYNNLANRIPLSARYYLKTSSAEGTMPDEVIQEIQSEASIVIWQIDPVEVAREITLMDFELFKSIHSVEYINDLFVKVKSPEHCPNLDQLTKITNNQMFWVIKEILRENQLLKRAKIIKFFIKLSKALKDMRSYNALFSVLSGLDHCSVRRLKATWEKVPSKYTKILEELQKILNPSWNMAAYRSLINGCNSTPPLIPILPIVKKDLTFLHLGNETFVDSLVNFEKLRMISREIRVITGYFAVNYDPVAMVETARSAVSTANPSNNFNSTSTMNNIQNPNNTVLNNSGTIQASNMMNNLSNTSSISSTSSNHNFKSLTLNNVTQKRLAFLLANPKKHYEEFLTRIKINKCIEEIAALPPINETELRQLSQECEPTEQAQLNQQTVTINTHPTSNTTSTLNSNSTLSSVVNQSVAASPIGSSIKDSKISSVVDIDDEAV